MKIEQPPKKSLHKRPRPMALAFAAMDTLCEINTIVVCIGSPDLLKEWVVDDESVTLSIGLYSSLSDTIDGQEMLHEIRKCNSTRHSLEAVTLSAYEH